MEPRPIAGPPRSAAIVVRLLSAGAIVLLAHTLAQRPLGRDDGTDMDESGSSQDFTLFIPFVPPDLPPVIDTSLHRAAAVMVRFPGTLRAYGSGFVADDHVVVTAAHVIAGDNIKGIRVFCNEHETDAEVLFTDPDKDIAVLSADCTAEPLRYALGEPDVQMRLLVSGFTFESNMKDGRVALIGVQYARPSSPIPGAYIPTDEPDMEDPSVQRIVERMADIKADPLRAIAASIEHGHSGSAVYTPDGALYGMAIISDGGRNRTFVVPASSILEALSP